MKARDFVSVEYIQKIQSLRDTLKDIVPVFSDLVDHGMPVKDHLDKLKAYQTDVEKLCTLLEVQ